MNNGSMQKDPQTGLCLKKDGSPRKLNKNKGSHLETPRAVSHDENGKTCIKCGIHKPLTEFYKWNYAKRSYSSRCKDCCHEKAQKGWQNIKDLPEDERYKRGERMARLINARNLEIKREVLSHYSGGVPKCANPFSHPYEVTKLIHLTIDHVNGGGKADRETVHGSTGMYRKLKRENYPDGYQVLCGNCQIEKAMVNGEHPRKYPITKITGLTEVH